MHKTAFYQRTAGPTGVPVGLAHVKTHLRITDDSEDVVLQTYLDAAVDEVEKRANILIRRSTFQGNYPYFKCLPNERYPFVELERSPVIAVTAVEVHDGASYVAVDASDYQVEQMDSGDFWRVMFPNGAAVATGVTAQIVPYPIRVTFTAGYADDSVPPQAVIAILNYVAWLYENRGDCGACDMPDPLRAVIGRLRKLRTF